MEYWNASNNKISENFPLDIMGWNLSVRCPNNNSFPQHPLNPFRFTKVIKIPLPIFHLRQVSSFAEPKAKVSREWRMRTQHCLHEKKMPGNALYIERDKETKYLCWKSSGDEQEQRVWVFFLVFGAKPRHYFLNFDDEDAAVAPAARSEENEQIAPAGRDESEGERRPLSLARSLARSGAECIFARRRKLNICPGAGSNPC